jgi:hypothetical protein
MNGRRLLKNFLDTFEFSTGSSSIAQCRLESLIKGLADHQKFGGE